MTECKYMYERGDYGELTLTAWNASDVEVSANIAYRHADGWVVQADDGWLEKEKPCAELTEAIDLAKARLADSLWRKAWANDVIDHWEESGASGVPEAPDDGGFPDEEERA